MLMASRIKTVRPLLPPRLVRAKPMVSRGRILSTLSNIGRNSAVHHPDTPPCPFADFRIVRDYHQGLSITIELFQEIDDFSSRGPVKVPGGFIGRGARLAD